MLRSVSLQTHENCWSWIASKIIYGYYGDIAQLENWLDRWLMEFNPVEVMQFGQKILVLSN